MVIFLYLFYRKSFDVCPKSYCFFGYGTTNPPKLQRKSLTYLATIDYMSRNAFALVLAASLCSSDSCRFDIGILKPSRQYIQLAPCSISVIIAIAVYDKLL